MPSSDIYPGLCDECGAPVESNSAEVERLKTLGELRHCEKCTDGELLHDDDCFYEYGRVPDPNLCTCDRRMPAFGCPGRVHVGDPVVLFSRLDEAIRMSVERASKARRIAADTEGAASESAKELAKAWFAAADMAAEAFRLAVQMTEHDRIVEHTPQAPSPYAPFISPRASWRLESRGVV